MEMDLEAANARLLETLVKMKQEREDIFEKNSVLEDACGKLMSEKVYMVQNLAKAVNTIGKLESELIALRSLSRAAEHQSR